MTTKTGLILMIIIPLVTGNHTIKTEPTLALAKYQEDVKLLCISNKPIFYCRFIIPNLEPIRITDNTYEDNYCHFGGGLQAGHCGIHIYRIEEENAGQVYCNMGYHDQMEEDYGFINLIVGREPSEPRFEAFQNEELVEGQLFYDRCITHGGRPATNITFFLNS